MLNKPECIGEKVHPRALIPELVAVADSEGGKVLLQTEMNTYIVLNLYIVTVIVPL